MNPAIKGFVLVAAGLLVGEAAAVEPTKKTHGRIEKVVVVGPEQKLVHFRTGAVEYWLVHRGSQGHGSSCDWAKPRMKAVLWAESTDAGTRCKLLQENDQEGCVVECVP
jgi:hypothetical protein